MNGKTHGSAPDLEKANDVLTRLRRDADLQKRLIADPKAVLAELGLATPGDVGTPKVVGSGDQLNVIFVKSSEADAAETLAEDTDPEWPWRNYRLQNETDRDLNLETWVLGIQEAALKVPKGAIGRLRVVDLAELISNMCNLGKGSHLVRDLAPDNVKGESWNVTCGSTFNRWRATGSGNDIKVHLTHG